MDCIICQYKCDTCTHIKDDKKKKLYVCEECYDKLDLCGKCNKMGLNEKNECIVCDYEYCKRCNMKMNDDLCYGCIMIDIMINLGLFLLFILMLT